MTQNLKANVCFMQNFRQLGMKNNLDLKAVKFEVWVLTTSLG